MLSGHVSTMFGVSRQPREVGHNVTNRRRSPSPSSSARPKDAPTTGGNRRELPIPETSGDWQIGWPGGGSVETMKGNGGLNPKMVRVAGGDVARFGVAKVFS